VTGNRVCWSRTAIDFATQVDVGGLEVDDPRADAVFRAIHQTLPVRREISGGRFTEASENDVLRAFTRPITSNEPLLLFVKGERGTGKSHLVRWLKSRLGARPAWHIVYIEKRNTSLRRVTEQILAGIDTPKAEQLRQELARASSEIASAEEAVSALLARLDHLVTFDSAAQIRSLPDVSAAELADLRRKAHRLLGDYSFRNELSKPDGPVHRIVRLARGETAPSEDVDEADLHLTEADLRVDPSAFDDTGPELQNLVRSMVSNRPLRADIAALCDWYLPRAKAEVFMGQGTDLLGVFEDVREEIAARRQELCLLIEDLVLLHGIDKQLAQALTIPASARLCKLRAVIAVTSGYLSSLDTFTNRGAQFTLDIGLDDIGQTGLRDFVSRYLNAGRRHGPADTDRESSSLDTVPNACLSCPDQRQCHETFGASSDDYGFYPFNSAAIDRLVKLASPGDFQPREILREVIRAPLETAEEELPTGGIFPSVQFGRALDEVRQSIAPGVRAAIRRLNHSSPGTELSLRAFYAESPPDTDPALEKIAAYLGDRLTPRIADDQGERDHPTGPQPVPRRQSASEIDQWANGVGPLPSGPANRVRRWVCDAVIACLQNGPYGLVITKTKSSRAEWLIGSHTLRLSDVSIERAQGGGALESLHPFRINATDENAVLIRGILATLDGSSLDAVDHGRWFFYLQTRISDYASTLARLAAGDTATALPAAVQVLEVLRHAASDPGQTVPDALAAMLAPIPPPRQNPVVKEFLEGVRPVREEALTIVRTHATAVKGTGKPSLLDAGPVLRHIQSHLRARSIEDPPGEGIGGQLLRQFQSRQSRASERAWSEVSRAVKDVRRFLDPGEDLADTFKIVDRLVKEGEAGGQLPRADSRASYESARNEVDAEVMEVYRRLGKKIAGGTGPGDLWDVLDDPLPRLAALSRFAAVTSDLLSALESKLAATPVAGAVDTDALIEEFRNLASLLDRASQGAQ
jgi:hypothetical protein